VLRPGRESKGPPGASPAEAAAHFVIAVDHPGSTPAASADRSFMYVTGLP
jgi:hypothetical protein